MNEKEILSKINIEVYNLLKSEGTGHDFFHIERVINNSQKIIPNENCDAFYTLLLAYLHDVGDYKLHQGVDKTDEVVTRLLSPLIQDESYIQQIIQDIHLIGFKGGLNDKSNKIEVQIVQDADRLDAMGAIGIARAFAYGGSKSRLLHDPHFKPENFHNMTDYKNSKAPTIQHFYDKLLKLKSLMNTATAKKIAEDRHRFMEDFLEQFCLEWES